MKKELLAPAGNMECLKAAVFNGADAVYMACKSFGARKFANNFDNNEISAKDLVSIYGHTFKTEGTDFNFNLNTNVLTYKGKPHATYYPQNK